MFETEDVRAHRPLLESLRGRVAVVTGGASGIGRGICEALLEQGAKVVVADVEKGALDTTVAELASGGDITGCVVDVSDRDSVEAMAEYVYETHGACHLLVNNAGVSPDSGGLEPWEADTNDWLWTFGVNVFGVANGVNAFVPRMLDGGEPGWVINTTSADGGLAPAPGVAVYSASKAAMSIYTESLAVRLAETGANIGASVFIPSGGMMRTGMFEAERNRPAGLSRSSTSPAPKTRTINSFDDLEKLLESRGMPVQMWDLRELGHFVLGEMQSGQYVIGYDRTDMANLLHDRANSLAEGMFGPTLAKGLAARRAGVS